MTNSTILHSNLKATEENTRINELLNQIIGMIIRQLGENTHFELYLFGSRAKNEAAEGADIDLAISCPQLSEGVYRKVKREIENIRTLYSIDLINLEAVDPDFKEIILADARKLYG
ncbi:nucleotidyltransferase domain protein [bacterium BMS3Abin15]|nr:nucleotidyltransferase domain protein [bacterium BMS3Abin15]